ncbi:hypothetical protein NB689_003346 [Xanthomonas sacchari]|nr:hypothetical protein [Xanthomonas sacchari]MCW0450714.1 hypothetical protein [Xanthomonas sacchari]
MPVLESVAATTSQPRSRSAAGRVPLGPALLGSEAMSEGVDLDSLPAANTTRPPLPSTNGRYSAAMALVEFRSVQ